MRCILAASVLSCSAVAAGANASVGCELRSQFSAGRLQLDAVVVSAEALQGRYNFEVSAGSKGGKSLTKQVGQFSIAGKSNGEEVVARITLNQRTYMAVLTVFANGKSVTCRKREGYTNGGHIETRLRMQK